MIAIRWPFLALFAAISLAPAHAATFCVDTSAELRTALQTATTNGVDDEIRIAVGTYAPTDADPAFLWFSDGADLRISGGWLVPAMFPCLVQDVTQGATVLDGLGARRVMKVSLNLPTGNFAIANVTIRRGSTADNGGGLDAGPSAGYAGNVVIERVVFDRNHADSFGGGLVGGSDGGFFTMRNNLFVGNTSGQGLGAAATLTVNAASAASYRSYFVHNTIVATRCDPGTCAGAVRYGGSARAAYFNNVFHDNDGVDLAVQGPLDLQSNHVNAPIGTPMSSIGNFTVSNPRFENPAAGNYRPRRDSTLFDGGDPLGFAGTVDLDGEPRMQGAAEDLGAYEIEPNVFAGGFEVLLR